MKKFRTILSFVLFFFFSTSIALHSQGFISPSLARGISLDQVETHLIPHDPSIATARLTSKADQPMWAGFSLKTEVFPGNYGTKVNYASGERSWMLRATSPGAPALALVFEQVEIPRNATIFVFSESNPNASYSISGSELNSRYVSTPPLPGDAIIIEYHEPAHSGTYSTVLSTAHESNVNNQQVNTDSGMIGSFVLTDLVVIYTGLEFLNSEKGLGASGPCMVNINCSPEGDNWQLAKRGVARILLRVGDNWFYCSGSLVNNTNQDGTPYFLTAAHCGQGATAADMNVWQFSFNFERAQCGNFGIPPTNMTSGCTLRALGPLAGGSDFRLVQLNTSPPAAWNPYFNGWDRSVTPSTGGVGIHHPAGDAKKISTYTGTLFLATPNIDGNVMAHQGAWGVVWAATTNGHSATQGGSSGSPIFNSQSQIVGTLAGGSSSCSSPSSPDFYGRFNHHWMLNGPNESQRLQPWLDPGNTGVTSLAGFDPFAGLQVNFTASKLVVNKNEQITFTDQSSGGAITAWNWNFGSGASPATATGQGPHTVSYSTVGYKTVSLTVNNQNTATKTNFIYVKESIMITQSASQAIGTSMVACTITGSDPRINSENSYFRVFDLANHHSISGDFEIRIVDVGIQIAQADNPETGSPITIRIYTSSSTNLETATLTQLYQQSFSVPNVSQVVRQFLLSSPVLVPAGSIVAVEVFTPSGGGGAGFRIFLGSNSDGQNTPTYFMSVACGIPTIRNLANVGDGFPNVHLVLNLWGKTPDIGTSVIPVNFDEIKIFPNPASNFVTISLMQGKLGMVEVFDTTGRSVLKTNLSSNMGRVNLSGLRSGVYFLRIETESGFVVRKLQVQR